MERSLSFLSLLGSEFHANPLVFDSTKLDNCVISNGVQIREKAVLKDCEIGRNVIIEAEGELFR